MRIPLKSYLRWSALAHFSQTAPRRLDNVPISVWQEVASIMFHLPDVFDWALEIHADLVNRVVRKVPKEAEAALKAALFEHPSQGITFTRKLRKAWTPRLVAAALESLQQLPANAARDVLSSLLLNGRREAKAFATASVAPPFDDQPAAQHLAVASAQALLATGGDEEFAIAWPLINSNPSLGAEILGADAPHSESRRQPLAARLREQHLADLFLWLSAHRPRTAARSFGMVGPAERLEELERHCLNQLQAAGTQEAVEAIHRIRSKRPDDRWLLAIQDDAERALRTNPGQRPTPTEILSMVEDHSKRFLSTEADLLQAIETSLHGLQAELGGDNPTVRFLWNTQPLTPRDEIDLSIFVTNHLRRDLMSRSVVLNREVNISTVSQTDIRVEAMAGDPGTRPLVVTVETKGSWHRELFSAMKTQLHDRYLADRACNVGLYLVGWFRTEGIEERGPRVTYEDLVKRLEVQAANLSEAPTLIRAFVLDCRWREEIVRPRRPKRIGPA